MSRCLMVAWLLCAWVMWEDVTISRRSLAEPGARWSAAERVWNILRTYDDAAACRADHSKLLAKNSTWYASAGSRLQPIDNGVSGEYVARDGEVFRREVKRALCVPDTIDPRPRDRGAR
jgi:hypothetical protein